MLGMGGSTIYSVLCNQQRKKKAMRFSYNITYDFLLSLFGRVDVLWLAFGLTEGIVSLVALGLSKIKKQRSLQEQKI